MIKKLGFISKIFTKKTDKLLDLQNVAKSTELGESGQVTMNTIWENSKLEHTTQNETYKPCSDPYLEKAIAGLDVKYSEIQTIALNNAKQETIDPETINPNDPNFISDTKQGFGEKEFCEA